MGCSDRRVVAASRMTRPTDHQRRARMAPEVAAHRHRSPQPTRPAPEVAATPAATHTLTAPCGRALAPRVTPAATHTRAAHAQGSTRQDPCHTYRPRRSPVTRPLVTVARRQPLRVGRVDDLVPRPKVANGVGNFFAGREVSPTPRNDPWGSRRCASTLRPAGAPRQQPVSGAPTTVHEPSAMQSEPRFRLTEASAVRAMLSDPRADLSGAPRRLAAAVAVECVGRRSSALRCRREYAASLVATARVTPCRCCVALVGRRDGDRDDGGVGGVGSMTKRIFSTPFARRALAPPSPVQRDSEALSDR